MFLDDEVKAGLAEIAAENRDLFVATGQGKSPSLIRLADVEPESVEWLWPGRIPLGKLSLLEGDPGLGKSTVSLDIAARVSRGISLPFEGRFGPCAVVLLSAEDGLADTIRPRLDAAAADVTRIYAPRDVYTLDKNLGDIESAVRSTGARLVIIDPLMAFLGSGVNSYKDQDVRRALAPLSRMADETGAAILVVRHLKKGGSDIPAIQRGGGSIGIIGAARSALLIAKDPKDETRRIVASVKSNLSKPPMSLAYRIGEDPNGAPSLTWEGEVEITADELLGAQGIELHQKRPRANAVAFLRASLEDGPLSAVEVNRAAESEGFTESTMKRARSKLGVTSAKTGFQGGWLLALPGDATQGGQHT